MGIIAFLISKWHDKFEERLFSEDGYFGKYLTLHHGYYGSIPQVKSVFAGGESKKRLRIYWLTMVPLGYVVGILIVGTLPVYVVLSFFFPSD